MCGEYSFFLFDSILCNVDFSWKEGEVAQERAVYISKEHYYLKKRCDCKIRSARGDI